MLHILTYDVAGTVVATGARKPCRTSGLVTHTHELLTGLSRVAPGLRLGLTHSGATCPAGYYLRTDAGQVALVQGIVTSFGDLLGSLSGRGKDPSRVRYFYEEQINRGDNPVYRSLARQYAHVLRVAGTPFVLAQNLNPIVGMLKAEDYGYLAADRVGRLSVTGVVHDTTDAAGRFGYITTRLARTQHRVRLIAVSGAVHTALVRAGVPDDLVRTIPNGLDIAGFERRLAQAHAARAGDTVRARNNLPKSGTMILMSARRVAWKGHIDVIDAARILVERGVTDFFVAINGNTMVDTRDPNYETMLARRITAARLQDRVFLLDDLSPVEVAACYAMAVIAVHPSRHPEAWSYANIEAMLGGAAVIAAAHGAPVDYIRHGHCGLLVPPRDPVAIADAIQRLLADPAERARLAHNGRAVAGRFTAEAMATAYHEVFAPAPADDQSAPQRLAAEGGR